MEFANNIGISELLLILVALVIVGGAGLFLLRVSRKSKGLPKTVIQAPSSQPQADQQSTKRCSQCNSSYTDLTLSYCLIDGAALVDVVAFHSSPGEPSRHEAPTVRYDQDVPHQNQ